ncbi:MULTISPECIES: hypothetical protein [Methylocystis]|uniref:Uncharacterized protein n=1 Tax=Methylocystis iwaonis TaxID=2885079 RepID=A0ABM8EET2_9HYPH|nr:MULTISPECIES: hypothetical protein [Methylocystis]MDJ0450932.1 hypothetical protein [Methylocystis sp. JR02]BDV36523.1 hypothetical protein SS37A_40530 [Methylocystis iwaonis]
MTLIKTQAARLAEERRRIRAAKIRAGQIAGLFEKGSRKVRPEIRALIDEALAKRASESGQARN